MAPIEPPVDLQKRRSAGVRVVAVVGAIALVAAVVVAFVATRGDDAGPAEVTATIEVGATPAAVAATDGAVWVANTGDDTVSHIDPTSNEVTATIDVDDQPSGIAATDEVVWVANQFSGTVSRIDPTTDDVVATVPVDGSPDQVAATTDAVWVTDGDHTLIRIDPATNDVTATVDVASGPSGVAATEDAVWVASASAGEVSRIDPTTNDVVATVEVAFPESVAIADGAVWVTGSGPAGKRAQETTPQDGIVSRIDPDTNEVVATVAIGPPGGVAVAGGAVWVASGTYSAGKGAQDVVDPGVVSRIGADTNEVTVTLDVGDGAAGVSATDDAVWVANQVDDTVSRIFPGT